MAPVSKRPVAPAAREKRTTTLQARRRAIQRKRTANEIANYYTPKLTAESKSVKTLTQRVRMTEAELRRAFEALDKNRNKTTLKRVRNLEPRVRNLNEQLRASKERLATLTKNFRAAKDDLKF